MENLLLDSSPEIEKKTEPYLSIESFLLDDIIIDILSRLPAKDVLRSRCVCRRWRDLTSTRDFTDLHSRRSFPMILKDDNGRGRALLDGCWETPQTRSKIHRVYDQSVICSQFSHNGLIVAHGGIGNSIIIYNPIYHDAVNITVPLKLSGIVYGVFFHPVLKEYCTLWRITVSVEPLKVQYRILNLESNPYWREIRNPSTQNARIECIRPILIDMYLYWMVDSSENVRQSFRSFNETFNCNIMEYDIRNEEFRVIPCPVPLNLNPLSNNVNLVDINGVVSLVQVFPSKESVKISILTLKDHREPLWTSSQFIVSSDICRGLRVHKPVSFWNGELVLQSGGSLYVYNLKLGTLRKFGQRDHQFVKFVSHVTSLVSLRNCNSNICMVEEDEL